MKYYFKCHIFLLSLNFYSICIFFDNRNMSVKDFFGKEASFKDKAEELIKTNDVKLLQAFIGDKNPAAFLQYNASFYLSKLNIRQAVYHATVIAPLKVKKYICEKIEKNECISVNANAEIVNVVSKTKQNLTNKKLLIRKCNSEQKFLLNSKSTDVKKYVEETNIGTLCEMTEGLAINVYDNLVKKNILDETIEHIANKKPSEIKHEFENEIEILNKKKDVFFEEFKDYNNHIQKIKDGSFLSEWYDELMHDVIKEALQNKQHLLYRFVDCYKQDDCYKQGDRYKQDDNANKYIAKILKKNIREFWNKELLTRISKRVYVNINKRDERKLLEYIDLTAHNFANHLLEKFDEMKSEVLENNVEKLVNNFTPFLVIEEEQKVLDYLLQIAARYKKKDMVLLLIFNGANFNTIENISEFIDEKSPAFFEVKRLYKGMPSLNLPKFTSEQIRDIFPIEDIVEAADLIIQQEELLHNKKKELGKKLEEEHPWYLFFLYLTKITAKINMIRVRTAEPGVEKLRKAFEESIPSTSLKPLKEELKDIRAGEGWFSFNTKTLEEIEKLGASTADTNKAVSVKELIEDIIVCKSVYMKDKRKEEMVHKEPNITRRYAEELELKAKSIRKEKQNLTKLQADLKDEEEKIEEKENKLRQKILKAEIKKEKEEKEKRKAEAEAEVKLRMADMKLAATVSLHEVAENYDIDITSVKEDVKEFLLVVFTFKVVNDTFASKFTVLLQNIKDSASSENYLFDKLQTEFKELCVMFTEHADKEGNLITKIPFCENPKDFEFMSAVITKMREAKKAAQKAKSEVEAEINEIIIKLL